MSQINVYLSVNENEYLDKVKGCWLGKSIGGTLGAPFEWHRQVNAVDFYTQNLTGEALPNDDLDIQLLWLIALEEQGIRISSRLLSEYWSLYVTPHWSEYGVAKANLRMGLVPPHSGYHNNPYRHSCGAFIRSEIWACIAPGLPQIAAKYAYEDAIIDHGGDAEGLYAEIFCASVESAAFVEGNINKLIDIGLSYIPENSGTAGSVKCAVASYKSGMTWLEARNAILEKYRGHCPFGLDHCISKEDRDRGFFDGIMGWDAPSNIGMLVIGLLYGQGDFGKTLCIAVNCGEDTDCTAATAGSIFGILKGANNIPAKWIDPIGCGIKTACLNLGELGFYGDLLPANIENLTERVYKITKQILLAHKTCINISNVPTDLSRLNSDILYAGNTKQSLYAHSHGPVYKFDFFDIYVEYCDGLTIKNASDYRIRLRIENTYKIQSNLNYKWYVDDGWQISPGKTGVLYVNSIINCTDASNIAEVDFILRNETITQIKNRFIVEITIEGKPTVMLVPIMLIYDNK